jgi:hypothetical protein
MKSFLIAITFALVAGLGVMALNKGKTKIKLQMRLSSSNQTLSVATSAFHSPQFFI